MNVKKTEILSNEESPTNVKAEGTSPEVVVPPERDGKGRRNRRERKGRVDRTEEKATMKENKRRDEGRGGECDK